MVLLWKWWVSRMWVFVLVNLVIRVVGSDVGLIIVNVVESLFFVFLCVCWGVFFVVLVKVVS